MTLLLSKRKTKKVVVLLCTGDTCRGPMAQGYMKHALNERALKHIDVKTAGVMTIPGLIPTPEASQVMTNAGIDISNHRSSPLTKELIHKADIILGMTPFHVQFALRESDEAKGKTYLLKEFAESDIKNYQITDPMGMTLEVYKRVYREMKLAIDKMLDLKEFFTGVSPEEARKAGVKPAAPVAAKPAPAAGKGAPAAKPAPAKAAPAAGAPAKGKVATPAAATRPAAPGAVPKKKVAAAGK
jgi:protein-tyrosine-phosphatase